MGFQTGFRCRVCGGVGGGGGVGGVGSTNNTTITTQGHVPLPTGVNSVFPLEFVE